VERKRVHLAHMSVQKEINSTQAHKRALVLWMRLVVRGSAAAAGTCAAQKRAKRPFQCSNGVQDHESGMMAEYRVIGGER
jgi:formate hydrogenlyase subunit 4